MIRRLYCSNYPVLEEISNQTEISIFMVPWSTDSLIEAFQLLIPSSVRCLELSGKQIKLISQTKIVSTIFAINGQDDLTSWICIDVPGTLCCTDMYLVRSAGSIIGVLTCTVQSTEMQYPLSGDPANDV